MQIKHQITKTIKCKENGRSADITSANFILGCGFKDENPFKKENKENFTQKDCTFLLLAKLPNGNIHQVLLNQDVIINLISELKDFKLLETPVLGIDFNK